MNEIPKKDWIQMQELLVSISKLLGEFREIDPLIPDLSKNIFKPSSFTPHKEISKTLRAVHLLTSLQNFQTEITGWIEVLSGKIEQKQPFQVPEKEINPSKGEKTGDFQKIFISQNPPLKETNNFKGNLSRASEPGSYQTMKPLQKAIIEVRSAIQALSTSKTIQEPKTLPLKTALQSIRPSLDQLVQTLQVAVKPKIMGSLGVLDSRNETPKNTPLDGKQIERPRLTMPISQPQKNNSESLFSNHLHAAISSKVIGSQKPAESPITVLFAPMNGKVELSDIRSKKKKKQKHLWEKETEEDPDSSDFNHST